jgi:non-heme chloroperoxidase
MIGARRVCGWWLAVTCSGAASALHAQTWTDPSSHRVNFVTVAPRVKLEVLDWGGTGPPLVFLSGLQDVAHGFDKFAPRFTDRFHVIGVTRRGYGASSQPREGYDLATRVADLRAVLDSLGLSRVALVGHSIAGDELTAFAGEYPDRVSALIYLDAAYDHSDIHEMLGSFPAPPPMLAADSASPHAVQAYTQRVYRMHIPEAQLRAIGRYDPSGHLAADVTPGAVDSAILAGCGHPDYARVHAPALVIDAVIDSMPQLFPAWRSFDPSRLAAARQFTASLQGWSVKERKRVRERLAGAEVAEVHGANHYVFDSNRELVFSLMGRFLARTFRQERTGK